MWYISCLWPHDMRLLLPYLCLNVTIKIWKNWDTDRMVGAFCLRFWSKPCFSTGSPTLGNNPLTTTQSLEHPGQNGLALRSAHDLDFLLSESDRVHNNPHGDLKQRAGLLYISFISILYGLFFYYKLYMSF